MIGCFPSKVGSKIRLSVFTIPIQQHTAQKQEKDIKIYWLKRKKTAFILRPHDCVHRKFQEFCKKVPRTISDFSMVARYMINI